MWGEHGAPSGRGGRRVGVEALQDWKRPSNEFPAYFDTARSNNGGTEAINGLIELHPPRRPRLP